MNTFKNVKTQLCSTLILCLLPIQVSFAQTHYELIPSISIIEQYDDNLYLDPDNEESDYITMVAPSINFNFLLEHTQLALIYTPTFVWYSQESEDNTLRHSGTLTFSQELSEHLQFDLDNTYTYTDDPFEEDDRGARDSRNTYQRNSGRAGLDYTFGEGNSLALNYRDSRLKNDDPSEDDGTIKNPDATLTYRINVQNQLVLRYGFTKAHFWRDDGLAAEDDFSGDELSLRYLYSFTPHTTGNFGYSLTTRFFEGTEEDYKVHDFLLGFDHAFSQDLSLSTTIGGWLQDREISSNESGYSYSVLISQQFQQSSYSIEGNGGWDETDLQSDDTGFSSYWSINTSITYEILERLTAHATGSFRHERDEDDWAFRGNTYSNRNYDTTRGTLGLRWTFFRWFSLALDYTYSERNDDLPTEDYKDNRVSLALTASRPYRW